MGAMAIPLMAEAGTALAGSEALAGAGSAMAGTAGATGMGGLLDIMSGGQMGQIGNVLKNFGTPTAFSAPQTLPQFGASTPQGGGFNLMNALKPVNPNAGMAENIMGGSSQMGQMIDSMMLLNKLIPPSSTYKQGGF